MGCHLGGEEVPPRQQLPQMCDWWPARGVVACPFPYRPHPLPCLPQPDPPACWEPPRTASDGQVTLSYSLPFPCTPASVPHPRQPQTQTRLDRQAQLKVPASRGPPPAEPRNRLHTEVKDSEQERTQLP